MSDSNTSIIVGSDGKSLRIDAHNVRRFSVKCNRVFEMLKKEDDDEEKRHDTFIEEFEPNSSN